ncbi:transcription factor gata-4 [Anaeramoeba flamelloides]|uniref:Transcription factor gata-4 n=1 Tax=Anaeramoeba flamelloides TaxID=1746091 RepID=A0ABQ8XVC2_9EUKA|nr:transcription factor gata-4 [Anaeramoeba flamelloides]
MERQCSNPNCQTTTTPSWRRIKGQLFCNACAIYSRRHQGKLRPKRKLKTQKKSLPKQRQTNKKTKNTRKRLNQRILITNTSKKHTKGNNFAKQRKLLKKKSSPKTILKKNRIPNYTIINQTLPQNQKQQSQRLLKTIKLKQKKQQHNKEKEKEKGKGKETETNHKQQISKNEKNLFSSLLNHSFPNYSSQINNSSKGVDQIQNKDEDNEKIKSSYCGKKLPDFLLKNSNVQFQIPTQTLTQIPTHKQQKPAQITQTSQQNNFFSRNFNQNIFPSNNSNILNNMNYKDDSQNINQNNFCFKNGNDHSKQNKNKNQNKPQNGFENFECKIKENINSNSIVYSKYDQKSERKIGKESKPNQESEQESKNETEQEKNAQDQEEFKEIPRKMCVTTLQAGDCVGLLLRDGDEVFAIIRKFVKEKGENGYRYCKVTWLVPKNDIQNTRISPTNLSRNHFFIGLDEPLPQSLQSITRKLNFRVL